VCLSGVPDSFEGCGLAEAADLGVPRVPFWSGCEGPRCVIGFGPEAQAFCEFDRLRSQMCQLLRGFMDNE